MGVEYRHYLVVKDLAWRPTAQTAKRVDEVLQRWKAIGSVKTAIDCSCEHAGEIGPDISLSMDPGEGLLIQWDTDDVDSETVRLIAGPSAYGPEADEGGRYFDNIILLIGSDYRVHPSSETTYSEVKKGAVVNGKEVDAVEFEEATRCGTSLPYLEFFPQSGTGSPPVVTIDFEDETLDPGIPFSGVWTGALVIDFGKDIAEFAFGEGAPLLPNRQFVTELENAFGTELLEVGEGY